jgi:hypothetical protein
VLSVARSLVTQYAFLPAWQHAVLFRVTAATIIPRHYCRKPALPSALFTGQSGQYRCIMSVSFRRRVFSAIGETLEPLHGYRYG